MTINKQIQFLKGSTILIASNLIIKGVNFFLLPLYTKYLTPEALGISDSITAMTSVIFPIFVLGLDSAFSAFYFDESTEEYHKKVFNTILVTLFCISFAIIIMFFFAKPISVLLFGTNKYDIIVCVALLSVIMNLWYLPFSLLVRMENKMLIFAIINFIASLSMIFLNIIFLSIIKMGVYSLILSNSIINLIQCCLYLKLSGCKPEKKYFDKSLLKSMLRYSLPLLPNVLATWILNMSDRYMILYFCGEKEVGLYGVAARFGTMVSFIASSFYMAYTTYAYDKKNEEDAPFQYARILNGFTFVILFICVTGSLFGKEIMAIMTEKSYQNAYLMLSPLLYSQLLYGINTIVGYSIGFVKKSKYILMITFIGAFLNVFANILLIPYFGAIGAAYTTLLSFLLIVIITYVVSQRCYYVDYGMKKIAGTIFITFIVVIYMQNINIYIKTSVYFLILIFIIIAYKKVITDILKVLKIILNRGK